MKSLQFIMGVDKDGTLNLEDKQLNDIFCLVEKMGGRVIPITGRTVGDIEETLKEKNIKMPQLIAGDNGAVVYSPREQAFLIKKQLEHDKVIKIIENFLENGGNPDLIRYTNGENIFTSRQKDVINYYKKKETVKSYDDICKAIQETEDITKITLAGTEEQMKQSAEFASKLDYWTDMDVTKFPKKQDQNYRLDIAQKNINKGAAIRAIVEELKPKYGYICIGNGYNDISMFKAAIEDNMIAAIMGNAPFELIQEMIKYQKEMKKGKVMIVPKDKDLANQYILKMAKIFQARIKEDEKKFLSNRRRLPNVPRVEVKGIDSKTIRKNNVSQRKERYR